MRLGYRSKLCINVGNKNTMMGFVYLSFGFPCQLAAFRMKNLIAETLV